MTLVKDDCWYTGFMSLLPLSVSQRNVSLRGHSRAGMTHGSPRSVSLPAGAIHEDDSEALVPMQTQASLPSRDSVREVLFRENQAIQRLGSSDQKDRWGKF